MFGVEPFTQQHPTLLGWTGAPIVSQTSPVLDLSDVLVSEWGANRSLQNLVESLKPEEAAAEAD